MYPIFDPNDASILDGKCFFLSHIGYQCFIACDNHKNNLKLIVIAMLLNKRDKSVLECCCCCFFMYNPHYRGG